MTTERRDQETGSANSAFSSERRHWPRLRRILEEKIVPSLVVPTQSVMQPTDRWHAEDEASDEIVALALQGREDQAKAEIRSLAGRGISFERLQLGLLAPAARKIGVLWEKDELSFVDVNLAVGTLQRLMHFIALDLYKEPLFGMAPKTVCIFPEPGAQHIMGASMAARFFQHSGWTVDFLPAPTERDIRRIVSGRHIDVIGISLNRLEMVDESAALIRRVIRDSQNRDIVAIGGGSAISRAPEVIDELGVDAVFAAIEFAPKQATNLIDERQRKGR